MEIKELYRILKYKRPADCWLCSNCDIENSTYSDKCLLCGGARSADSIVLKAYVERVNNDRGGSGYGYGHGPVNVNGNVKRPDDRYHGYEPYPPSNNKITWIVIITTIIILGIIGLMIAIDKGLI